ncbi:isocitrate lyase/PEP mutase family protein [Parvibaculum sp.]|uniref:isocitrate lyase/PEP mutase family protein n=1 Tax=Parvibaculum sp. TaxID=2024848 RepID=UPI001B0F63F8|nr:isocitrate lyase/PEP mutase family protein [Parvibaculum sp.]MBO6635946.1 isocitrate lyase/PEP mutase family protein [Parvibaculum sp.]MBO6677931.1 isocitrate lyase/PEP mutase family protein [Parvibaculum sp.]MBO6683405.1 isocitrate lyase/PEP mutase family protein [Parvibaculum sp.]MBO6904398.1 isocitrate lyase/PEP mutase family protein [Parvibaculum sp.]
MSGLSELLSTPGILVAPGAYDALSAKLAAEAGAKVVYMTGFGVSGAAFGLPDIGLVSAAEMSERVRAIAGACAPVPLIADGDNGHGGPLNAGKLARAYEAAGADCIQIEDQVFPKRCGHMEGKEVVPVAEAAAKIRAAAEARVSRDFKVMARTDARATHDLDEALRRGEAFLEAGADILFIEAPHDEDEMRKVAETFKGVPLVANIVEDGKTPYLGAKALEALGFKIALFPVSALLAVTARLEAAYATLVKGEGFAEGESRVTFQRYNELIGLNEMLADAAQITKEIAKEGD